MHQAAGQDLAKQERDINALKTQMNKNGTPSKMEQTAVKKHLTQQERQHSRRPRR